MSNSSTSPVNRGDRPNSFDRVPTMKPPLRLGNGFTANSNPWDGSGSIWGSSSNPATFVDGAADLELRSGSVSHSNGGTHHFRGRISSGSLLSSSESDCWNGRPNFPWSTATNGTSSAISRPQGQALSAVHLRNGEHKTSTADPQPNGRDPSSLFPIDQYSHFDASNYTPQDPSRQPTSVSQSRNMTSNKFLHFNVDHKEEEKRRNTNNASFRANSSAISTPSSLRFLNTNTESPSLPHGKVHPNNAPTKSRNNFDLPDMLSGLSRAPYPSDLSYNSPSHPSHHPSASAHRSFSGVQDRALQYDRLEDQLSARFHNMDLQAETMSQDLASRFQPQGHLQRAPHNLDRSFEAGLSRPVSHKGSEDMGLAGTFPASSDGMAETGYPFSGDYYRSMSFGERGSSSPAASDYRRGLSTPLYSTNGGTPPTRPESVRSASGSGFSNHASNSQLVLLDRESRAPRPPSSEEQYTMSSAPQARMQYNQPYEIGGYHGPLRLNPLALPYPLPPYHGLTNSYPSRYPSRENDASQIVRSPLLEDFRANHKTSKRYELKDIYGHVVEFSGDQHGSRFIQQKLETANSDEKDQIFAEIQPNSLQLMTDVFGNYVVQKLFEHGNQAQKKILANQMKNHVMDLSTQMYGCRVVQKALEHILTDQQAAMVKELEAHVLKCVKDQNGNHVIQKAIERVPAEHIQFIINAFTGQVNRLAAHPYGCRVIQRMLEHCEEPARQSILRELHAGVYSLITDQYGNYVIQHVIEKGQEQDRTRVVATVISQLLSFSKHKFASNVVEKSIQCANASQRAEILRILTSLNEKGESPLLGLMRDQYGNYVIQKSLREFGFKDAERKHLVEHCKPEFEKLKKFSSGKQVLALEKLIYDDDLESNLSSSQSSTIPSTNTSTVEGPTTFTLPPLQILKQPLATESVTAIASTPM